MINDKMFTGIPICRYAYAYCSLDHEKYTATMYMVFLSFIVYRIPVLYCTVPYLLKFENKTSDGLPMLASA